MVKCGYQVTKAMKMTDNQSGFTLLELIISIALIAVITGIAMGGIRLGITTRDVSENKADLYQRLRFISVQISEKIKSIHPLFVKLKSEEPDNFFETKEKNLKSVKLLLFEGLPDSMRFITFSNALSMIRKPPWMHEVQIYLGENPQTGEKGLIMAEKDIAKREAGADFSFDAPGINFITLAENVAFIKFHYYVMTLLTKEELTIQEDQTIKHKGKWVDRVIIKTPEEETKETFFLSDQNKQEESRKNQISLPRAVEISIGLIEKEGSGVILEPEVVYLPPTIFPLNTGTEFARPPLEKEKTDDGLF